MATSPIQLVNLGLFQQLIAVAWGSRNPIILVITQTSEDEDVELESVQSGQLNDQKTGIEGSIAGTDFNMPAIPLQDGTNLLTEDATTHPSSGEAEAPPVGTLISQDLLDFYYVWQFPRVLVDWNEDKGFEGHINVDVLGNGVGPIGRDHSTVTVINVSRFLNWMQQELTPQEFEAAGVIRLALAQSFQSGPSAATDTIHELRTVFQFYRVKPDFAEINPITGVVSAIGAPNNARVLNISFTETYPAVLSTPGGPGNPHRNKLLSRYGHLNLSLDKTTGLLVGYTTGA